MIPEGFVCLEAGRPTPAFLARWRAAGRPLATWRPLPAETTVAGPGGLPTQQYAALFRTVFGIGLRTEQPAFTRDGTMTREHYAIWREI